VRNLEFADFLARLASVEEQVQELEARVRQLEDALAGDSRDPEDSEED